MVPTSTVQLSVVLTLYVSINLGSNHGHLGNRQWFVEQFIKLS